MVVSVGLSEQTVETWEWTREQLLEQRVTSSNPYFKSTKHISQICI
jgi:hypothetical protein